MKYLLSNYSFHLKQGMSSHPRRVSSNGAKLFAYPGEANPCETTEYSVILITRKNGQVIPNLEAEIIRAMLNQEADYQLNFTNPKFSGSTSPLEIKDVNESLLGKLAESGIIVEQTTKRFR